MVDLNESFDSQASLDIPDLMIEDDSNYMRRFIVGQPGHEDRKLYYLKHPKTKTKALYEITENGTNEVLKMKLDGRSTLLGESVIKETELFIMAPIHPFFLLIPELIEKKPMSKSIDNIFEGKLLAVAQIPSALKALDLACTVEVVDGRKHYSYDHDKLISWCMKRFNIYVEAFKASDEGPAAVRDDEAACRYYCFTIFTDYICESLGKELQMVLEIEKPEVTISTQTVVKRKSVVAVDPKPLNSKQRRLQKASKGVQSLSLFFTKKP
ncbi:unnamed protein product [Bursaphelenchus okinawaensis]|uniref:Uncharacterized protein n=1 Tax=Bursaphelenchus okinawaensis TaxID=465554 RepID=A0A811KUT7_9BILA|nr:unnamed protein product [Bursaphelenchus okinawaensis]CAG9111659.1 unnamed protein product [Bursaphelenchus okinawaensis]